MLKLEKARPLALGRSWNQMERSGAHKLSKNLDALNLFLYSPNNYWMLTCFKHSSRHQGYTGKQQKRGSLNVVSLPHCFIMRTNGEFSIKHLATARVMLSPFLIASPASLLEAAAQIKNYFQPGPFVTLWKGTLSQGRCPPAREVSLHFSPSPFLYPLS